MASDCHSGILIQVMMASDCLLMTSDDESSCALNSTRDVPPGHPVQGIEYTFDNIASCHGSGVIRHVPYYEDEERRATLPLRCKLLLGRSVLSAAASHEKLIRMAPEWPASSYADDADDADDFPDDLPNPNGTRMACELVRS